MDTPARLLLCLLAFVPFHGYAESANASKDQSALKLEADPDVAWQQIKALESPMAPQGNRSLKKTQAEVKAERRARAERLKEVSRLANAFHVKHPNHPSAVAAKALEITALFDAVAVGEVAEEPKARRLGMKFRNDASLPELERFHIATRMMHFDVVNKKPVNDEQRFVEYVRHADNLLAEFPKSPEVYRIYLGVVRNASEALARKTANKILLGAAPEDIKEQARLVIDRYDMIGKPVEVEFLASNGSVFDINGYRGKVVVLHVWSAQSPSFASAFRAAENATAKGHIVAGICVDKDITAAKILLEREKPAGAQYLDERGMDSPIAARLKIVNVPSVYVFAPSGVLAGIGSAGELDELLKKAAAK